MKKTILYLILIIISQTVNSQNCSEKQIEKIYNNLNEKNPELKGGFFNYTIGFSVGFLGSQRTNLISNFDTLIDCKKYDEILKLIHSEIPETKYVASYIISFIVKKKDYSITKSEKKTIRKNFRSFEKVSIFLDDFQKMKG